MVRRTSHKVPKRRERHSRRIPGFIVLVVSGIFLGVVVGQVYGPKAEIKTERVVVGSFDAVDVFVPVGPVARGTQLEKVHFKKIRYPSHQVPSGAIEDPTKYLTYFATVPLPAGLPIDPQNLSPVRMGSNPVAEKIPTGMRAMTVKVDPTSLVNGWAGPGSLVDVALLTPERSQVIAERIRILSTEKFVAQVDGAPAEGLPSTATILVDQAQALAISAALPHGKLMFLLRNVRDEGAWTRREFNIGQFEQPVVSRDFKGFISVKEGASFALEDEGWVPVMQAPTGALVGK
jgi:Flp pilus assembly protein CpaB